MQAKFPIQWLYPAQTSESRWLSAQAQDAESASGGKLLAIVDGRLVAVPSDSPGLSVGWEAITGKPAVFPPNEHSHSQYLTEAQIQALITALATSSQYLTEAQIQALIDASATSEVNLNLDAFGRALVGAPATLAEHGFEYDLDPLFLATKVVGGGTLTHNSNKSSAILAVTNALNDRAVIQQRRYNYYERGKAQIQKITGVFGTAVADVKKRLGYFDDRNGVWLEQDGTNGFKVVLRSYVTGAVVDTEIPQSSWTDQDGNPSELATTTLNPAYQQIFGMDTQFLGAGMVKTFLNIDGENKIAHCFRHSNRSSAAPYMRTFTLPCRYEILQGGTTGSADFQAICMEVESNGGDLEPTAHEFSIARNAFLSVASGTWTGLIAIRPKTTFGGVINRVPALLDAWHVYSEDRAVEIELVFDATLAVGGAWVSVGSESSIEYNDNITSVTGGTVFKTDCIGLGRNAGGRISGNLRTLYPLGLDVDGANPTNICLQVRPRSGSSDCTAGFQWRELR